MFNMKRISIFKRKTLISAILYQINSLIKFTIRELLKLTINNSFDHIISLRLNNKDYYKAHNRSIS